MSIFVKMFLIVYESSANKFFFSLLTDKKMEKEKEIG